MMIFSSRRTYVFLASLLTASLFLQTAVAERLISTSDESSRRVKRKGGGDSPPTQVADLDTETRESSNLQYFTKRRIGSFTDMARNSAGTLYAVQDSGEIVTLNEADGIATKVVQVFDPASGPFGVKVPAIEFVGETLYAIIKRQPMYLDGPPELLSGYFLVSVDLSTGEVTDHAVELGGRNSGDGHGLAYDAVLNRLVYFYTEGGGSFSSPFVELIDVVGETKESVPFENTGEVPGGFTGVVSLGNSEFLVFDKKSTYDFYSVAIYNNNAADDGAQPIAPPTSTYQFSSSRLTNNSTGNIRGLALTADENNVVALNYGHIEEFTKSAIASSNEPIATSIGGFPAGFSGLATSPVTGDIFALTFLGDEGLRRPIFTPLFGPEEGPGIGLYKIDRSGPEANEVTELDVEFSIGEDSDYGYPESIAFDEKGKLYGFSRGDGQFLVEIDLANGEVKNPVSIDLPMGYNHHIEYNPEDGCFYVLFYNEELGIDDSGDYGIHFAKVTRGGAVTMIPVNGDFMQMNPNSFVFVGQGTFHFTQENLYDIGNILNSIDTNGTLTLLEEPVVTARGKADASALPIQGLSQAGILAKADVAVGETRSRLRGNNVYSRSGSGQRVSFSKRVRRLKVDFFATVENDGAYPGVISLKGTRARGRDTIRYTLNGRNVTAAIFRGLSLTMGSGDKAKVKASLSSRSKSKRWVSTNRVSASYGRSADTGVIKSTLILPVTKKSGSRKPTSLF